MVYMYIVLQYNVTIYTNHIYLMMALCGRNMSRIYMKACCSSNNLRSYILTLYYMLLT
jgi:hypothetical protein